MVKAYLRYDADRSVGVITSRECNVVLDRSGKHALTGTVEAISLWNLRQGALVRDLKTSKGFEKVTQLCIKGGDKSVCAAGYSDGAVRLWNLDDALVLQTFQGHRSGVSCLAFNSTGHLLASGSNDTDIVIWDITAEAGIARLRGHVDQVTAVLFWEGPSSAKQTSDASIAAFARVISSSKDRMVRIWSIELQICLQTVAEHQSEVWSLAFNKSQTRLVAGSADKFLRVWSLVGDASGDEGDPLAVFLGTVPRPNGQGSAVGLEFVEPKGLEFEVLLCQGTGRALEVFRCHDDTDIKRRQKRRKRRAQLKHIKKVGEDPPQEEQLEEYHPFDDQGDDQPRAADELAELPPHRLTAKAVSMAWSHATGELLVALSNNELEIVKLSPANPPDWLSLERSGGVDLPGHRTPVRAVAVASDDSLLMSASAEAVKVWNTSTGRCVRTMPSGYGLCGFFVSGNEHVLLGTKEGNLELYDLRVAELAQQHTPHKGAVYGTAEAPDHKGFVSCSADKHLRFFEFTFSRENGSVTFEELADKAIELPDEGLAVTYSPNGKWVVVALLNHTVQLYFSDTLKFYLALYGHRLPVMAIDITSDSQMVASGSADKNVRLWSTQFGNCHRSLRAHDDSVMQVRFLPGTHYLATAGRDRELKLWDCDTYELITVLRGHATEILALALSQDAAFIATASSDRQLRFWRRGQEQLFLSEERARELEDRFEQEVEREDVPGAGGGGAAAEVVALRPSRRTVESIRTTERLMEVLDEAAAAESEDGGPVPADMSQHPCARVVDYVNTLTASNIYEVLLALPFSHALRLLSFICRFFEAVSGLPSGRDSIKDVEGSAISSDGSQTRVLSAVAMLETPCQAALIATYVHHHELAATPSARALLLRLREHMRRLLQAEKDRIGLSVAGFAHLQRTLKRSAGALGSRAVGQLRLSTAAKIDAAKKRKRS